jgi:hypothetical protein
VFTARYALCPYIKQIRFVFKGLSEHSRCPDSMSNWPRQEYRLAATPTCTVETGTGEVGRPNILFYPQIIIPPVLCIFLLSPLTCAIGWTIMTGVGLSNTRAHPTVCTVLISPASLAVTNAEIVKYNWQLEQMGRSTFCLWRKVRDFCSR